MSGKTLKISNLSVAYGRKVVVENVGFTAQYGKITALVGANGSGKTTILKAIVGDVLPVNGEILIGETQIAAINFLQRAKRIAIVEQHVDLYDIRVCEYIMLGRTPHRSFFSFSDSEIDKQKVDDAMASVGVAHLKDMKMSEISGGERQMVAIAKAIVQEPEVLLLDEPTANLDIANQIKILDTIAQLTRERQIATIVILHDINQACAYAQQLVILKKGTIIAVGNPENVATKENIELAYEAKILTLTRQNTNQTIILPEYNKIHSINDDKSF